MTKSPKVLVNKAKDSREVDLVSRLLLDRIVYLGQEIDNTFANSVVQQFICLQLDDAKKPITLYINSPGGSIVDGMAIYDTIQRSTCPVHAVVAGMAASMGAVILSGCTKGERAVLAHGEVLLHQPLGGARGQATDHPQDEAPAADAARQEHRPSVREAGRRLRPRLLARRRGSQSLRDRRQDLVAVLSAPPRPLPQERASRTRRSGVGRHRPCPRELH
jgi:ATP-dependent Clp endopeptidase proteolytic subunit ClpP